MKQTIICLIFILFADYQSVSSQNCDCNPSLFQDIYQLKNDRETVFYLYKEIDQLSYNNYKSNKEFELKIPFYNKFIKGTADFEEFKTEFNKYYEKEIQSYKETNKTDLFSRKLTDSGYLGYSNCLKACKNEMNFNMWLVYNYGNSIVVRLEYTVPAKAVSNVQNIIVKQNTIENGSVIGLPAGEFIANNSEFKPAQSVDITIMRTNLNENVKLSINVGNYSQTLTISGDPKPLECKNFNYKDIKLEELSRFLIYPSNVLAGKYQLIRTTSQQPEVNNQQWHLKFVHDNGMVNFVRDTTPYNAADDLTSKICFDINVSEICELIK